MKKLSSKMIGLIEIGGWYGVIAILSAYMGVSFGYFTPSNFIPVFLNITGSFFMLVDAWKDKNWQPVTINVVWILIALVTLGKAIL